MTKNLNIKKFYNTIIVGSGISGSVLAYELQKRNRDFLIFSSEKSALENTSSLSFGHTRIVKKKDLEKIVNICKKKLGENEKKTGFIYSNSHLSKELFNELDVPYQKRSFGIIPKTKKRGGFEILKRLQKGVDILTETILIDFERKNDVFALTLNSRNKKLSIQCKNLILCTGGYGGTFKYNDNIKYKIYNIFDLVKKNKGSIINLDSIFVHPFGYLKGRLILIGKESKKGEFVNEKNELIFPKRIRKLIKEDNYHESFSEILKIIYELKAKKRKIFYVFKNKKLEIVPTVHYTSGGIQTNHLGEVKNIKNLYAIGECQANGDKNTGRLPGYPFTSAIVYGKYLSKILK
ncbi:MAG: FAD-binding protein [Candidatus Moranbacteria bacterium]|nr:FAD-binding protein [Candidatus Moranbacteria bacterium]